MTEQHKLLWVDDEVEFLTPHILFLEKKGIKVTTALSGSDALDILSEEKFDVLFLDENMPGLSGIETLEKIREQEPFLPIVMVTKSDEETLMNQALVGEVADFLIKPVNPSQLLLSLKKILQKDSLINEATVMDYQQEFRTISTQLMGDLSFEDWKELYKKLMKRSVALGETDQSMSEMFDAQRKEAQNLFCRYVRSNYENWVRAKDNRPMLSPDIFSQRVFPLLDQGEKVFFVLIDNFRYDQWLSVRDLVSDLFHFQEDLYLAILPTETQYARNAIFSGLMPDQIAKMFPDLWVDEESEEGKNLNEEPMIQTQLDRYRKNYSFSYNKVYDTKFGEKLLGRMDSLAKNPLNIIVLNFVDMLSHARTESKMIRELAHDEAAYRSLTRSWFKHSTSYRMFAKIAEMGYRIILTTDHGTIRVNNPVKIVGDRNTSTNLRYKLGRNLSYNEREVYACTKPRQVGLPEASLMDKFVFCSEDDFFAYPNNYNYYVSYYRDTFQHGGISMEEMLVPIIELEPK